MPPPIRRPLIPLVVVLAIALVAAAPARAALRPVGHIGGLCDAVEVSGAAVYAGFGAELARLTATAPPSRSGWALLGGEGFVRDVAIVGQTAYVAQQGGGVRVVGLGTALGESASVVTGVENAYGVAAVGDLLFVAVMDYGLRIYNIATPTSPSLLGSLAMPAGASVVWDVAVAGDYAYLAAGGYGIWIVNVATPSEPADVDSLDTGNVYRVETDGSWVYAASGVAGLSVCEITGPGTLVERDSFATSPYEARDVAVSGTVAYVAANDLVAVDLTDPTDLQSLGSCAIPGGAIGVAADGADAYVAAATRGLHVVHLAGGLAARSRAPGPPAVLGAYDPLNDAKGVAVVGSTAWVAAGQHGLRAVNVSNPGALAVVASYDTGGYYPVDVAVADGRAHLAETHADYWDGALEVVNLGGIPTLTQAGFYHASAPAYALALGSGVAYLALGDSTDGVRVIDVDPASGAKWQKVGDCSSWWTGAYPRSVVLDGDLLLAGTDLHGVQVADVSTATAPTWATAFEAVTNLYNVAAAGRYVYAREAQGSTVRILVLDLEDVGSPSQPPVWVDSYWPAGSAGSSGCCRGDLDLEGDMLYATFDSWGVRALGLGNPAAPVEAAAFDTPLPATSVNAVGSLVYVGMDGGGLLVLLHDLFSGGFESGDFSGWTTVVGAG